MAPVPVPPSLSHIEEATASAIGVRYHSLTISR